MPRGRLRVNNRSESTPSLPKTKDKITFRWSKWHEEVVVNTDKALPATNCLDETVTLSLT